MATIAESAFLTIDDLKTCIHRDVVDAVTRADDDIVNRQIHAAIGMAKSYLTRYDLAKLFGDDTIPTSSTVSETQLVTLKQCVLDIAAFKLLGLSNVNYELAKYEGMYLAAIKWLREIQAGVAIPEGWPLRDTSTFTSPDGDQVSAFYNEKRTNRL